MKMRMMPDQERGQLHGSWRLLILMSSVWLLCVSNLALKLRCAEKKLATFLDPPTHRGRGFCQFSRCCPSFKRVCSIFEFLITINLYFKEQSSIFSWSQACVGVMSPKPPPHISFLPPFHPACNTSLMVHLLFRLNIHIWRTPLFPTQPPPLLPTIVCSSLAMGLTSSTSWFVPRW